MIVEVNSVEKLLFSSGLRIPRSLFCKTYMSNESTGVTIRKSLFYSCLSLRCRDLHVFGQVALFSIHPLYILKPKS